MKHPKVMIVGTVPFNKNMTSRAFDAYFHNWERENLCQFFSNNNEPIKGHCGSLYQITDHHLLERVFNKKRQIGKVYKYDELSAQQNKEDKKFKNRFYKKLYSVGHKKTPIIYLLRGCLWRKKYWCNNSFNKWLDNFKPECVFLSFSDDFFIPRIALYIAERYDIPIVSSIGDDYYFNNRISISPFYYVYRYFYKKLIRKVFQHKGSAIYISDKIKNKYNKEFGLNGETIYLTSELKRRKFKPINKKTPIISYFGNINLGRNYLLNEIGNALSEINKEYYVNVYSNETDKKIYNVLANNTNINFHGKIPYDEVIRKTNESDILIIVEGWSKKDILATKYSLSTKAADSLASGVCLFTYGNLECGIIEYMKKTNASAICLSRDKLKEELDNLINNIEYQKELYKNAILAYNSNHILKKSNEKFENLVIKTIKEYR